MLTFDDTGTILLSICGGSSRFDVAHVESGIVALRKSESSTSVLGSNIVRDQLPRAPQE
jgi:hypothetical protein